MVVLLVMDVMLVVSEMIVMNMTTDKTICITSWLRRCVRLRKLILMIMMMSTTTTTAAAIHKFGITVGVVP